MTRDYHGENFSAWMRAVRHYTRNKAGIEPFEIEDYPYYDFFKMGYSAHETAKDALAEEGYIALGEPV